MTPKQVLAMIKEKGAVMVDIKFIDLLGSWQHFAVPISEFKDEAPFEEGLGIDGSSIRGWMSIESSDMLVVRFAIRAFAFDGRDLLASHSDF